MNYNYEEEVHIDKDFATKRWVFTLNNYTAEETLFLQEYAEIQFLFFGHEIAPTTQTPHLQGFVQFLCKKRLQTAKKTLGTTRIRMLPMKGTYEQNIKYCSKDDNAPFEKGEWTDDQGKRYDLCKVRNLAHNEGMRALLQNKDVCKNNNHYQFAKNYLTYCEPKREISPVEIIWIWGPPRSGKTKLAYEMAGDDYYIKSTGDHWFDGYDRHEVMIMDDIRPSWMKFEDLLHVLDRYPHSLANKGGFRQLHCRKIIITTWMHPEVFSKEADPKEPVEQLVGRCTRIIKVERVGPEVQKGNTKLSAPSQIPWGKQEIESD